MTYYTIITKQDGTFGVQRAGSTEVHGSFDSFAEACEAIGMVNLANQSVGADVNQY